MGLVTMVTDNIEVFFGLYTELLFNFFRLVLLRSGFGGLPDCLFLSDAFVYESIEIGMVSNV